ncbi:DUF262 domain-containing protein [Lactobacillus delbrueckii]|uniref:DUF262 domain-containing protein n=1 Tax=Lactobacillus delbrueckii TaxID=1584 RepID=UPI0037C6A218
MQKINKTDTLRKVLEKQRFTVDYFQREYRWGQKQIEQMLDDFQSTFEEFYDPEKHDTPEEVAGYGYYYMGCIICTGDSVKKIIDGQQRLTSLTLLLIYLNHLQKKNVKNEDDQVPLDDMIYSKQFSKKSFNIDVADRTDCMRALLNEDSTYVPTNESSENMLARYSDIEDYFPNELKGEALPFFINWVVEKVLLLEIDTPSEDEAHTIFLTMNDRGLSLNSAEMMKAYIIQQVAEPDRLEANHKWQENINKIKNASSYDTSGVVNTQDVEFISIWLRAKYANSMRDTKRGAKDEDYELLGDKFHTWVRNNAHAKMDLIKPKDYKEFVLTEMTRVTDLYLRMKKYGTKLTPGYEEVFYNANRDLTYQTMLAIAAIRNDDTEDIVEKKIQMTAKFVDDFATIRILNFKKVNWNTNKYLLFHVMQDIRNANCKTIGMVYVRTLRRMDVSIEGITRFSLNQFSGRYMLHILARFTSHVNVLMGNPSHFEEYVDRKRQGNTYDIEHILPDKYEDYKDSFKDYDDFEATRNQIGNLILLTRDKNRSYQAMKYTEKVQKYAGDNILAQALNDTAYTNNPQFIPVANEYGFHAIPDFEKQSIADRAEIYLKMASDIWNPDAIKQLAGGWSDDEEKDFFKNEKGREFTVGYADRSWPDALKYGFLSANLGGSGKSIYNVQVGDTVYCHIAGSGFVGIGECTSTAVPMKNFIVQVGGKATPIADAPWASEESKQKLDPNKEVFIGVDWKKYVTDPSEGYWEKGMTTVPLVAYMLNDKTTHQKVRDHFGYSDDAE